MMTIILQTLKDFAPTAILIISLLVFVELLYYVVTSPQTGVKKLPARTYSMDIIRDTRYLNLE